MQRLLTSMFVLGLSLGVAGCDDGAKETTKTAKKDDKAAEAKSGPQAADAKADDAVPPEAKKGDAPDPEAKKDGTAPDPSAEATPAADDGPDEALEGYDPRVAKAAHVAAKISEAPDDADNLLAAANLDRDKLDDLMYEIANDPDLTAQYRMARGI